MKMNIIILLSFITIISCEKEKNDSAYNFDDLKGTWINSVTDYDALIFKNESILERKVLTTNVIHDYYDYEIKNNSIVLQYTGKDKISLPRSSHKLHLNESKDTLIIYKLSQYYPKIEGDKFYKYLTN